MYIKSLIRWLVIVGSAAYGLYGLLDGLMHLSRQHDGHWAFRWLFLAPLIVLISGVLLRISYFTFIRQYRRLCTLIAAVVAVAAFGCIITAPEWIGISPRGHSDLSVVGGFLSIMALVAAWYGAQWVYRRTHNVLVRCLLHESHEAGPVRPR